MMKQNKFWSAKLLILAVLLFLFASCEPKRLGEAVFDLNDFSFGLSVNRLYENELKKEISQKYSAYSDTVFNDKDGIRKAVAVKYLVSAEKSEGPFAKFKNVSFYNMQSLADVNDNLMMISADANCGYGDQMRLLHDLKKEYGKPVVKQHIVSFTSFTWRLDDRTIQIQLEVIPDYENDKNKKGDYLNPNGGFLKSDSYEPNHVYQMFIHIFDNDYIQELKEQYVYSENGHKPYLYDYDEKTVSPY
ncbi:MAG: hypothetical protein EOP00_14635 [Pedobacter sp.]|nr:MAG: hypothetical protein EOP00_14635 [Pedobacter sp.]